MPPLLHGQAEAGRHRWSHRPVRAPVRQAGQAQLSSALSGERRAALLGAKARALVNRHIDGPEPDASPDSWVTDASTLGAGVVVDDHGWYLADDRPARSLGQAMAWAEGRGLVGLAVMAETDASALARRAACFAEPPSAWHIDDTDLIEAEPEPLLPEAPPDTGAWDHVELLERVGVDVVVEHGVVTGEVVGLEIARVVTDDDGTSRLEVGVGRHDREAFAALHGDRPTDEALASVAESVRPHRRTGAAPHPLGRLAAARWLRGAIVDRPDLVDGGELVPVSPAFPRTSVKEPTPATALGTDDGGEPLVVTCSVGLDLDVVAEGADLRAHHAPEASLTIVVPERDAHPLIRAAAAALSRPARVVTVPSQWRDGLGPQAPQ